MFTSRGTDKGDVVCILYIYIVYTYSIYAHIMYMYIYTYMCVHIYIMEYYSAIKKNEIMPRAVTWKQLQIMILSEVGQPEKDKHHTVSLTCGI